MKCARVQELSFQSPFGCSLCLTQRGRSRQVEHSAGLSSTRPPFSGPRILPAGVNASKPSISWAHCPGRKVLRVASSRLRTKVPLSDKYCIDSSCAAFTTCSSVIYSIWAGNTVHYIFTLLVYRTEEHHFNFLLHFFILYLQFFVVFFTRKSIRKWTASSASQRSSSVIVV